LSPYCAIDLLGKTGDLRPNDDFIRCLTGALAKCQPGIYLTLDPDGTKDFTPGDNYLHEDWDDAIKTLSMTDPLAAANAWQKRKLENNHDQILMALLPVLEGWKDGNQPIVDWVNQITDPELRNLAQHARLMALAKKDPHAALSGLYSTPLRRNNDLWHDAPSEVLRQLAKQDFPAALRLLKETSQLFGLPGADTDSVAEGGDPFADPFAESPPSPVRARTGPPPNPFIALSHNSDTPEDNWMRYVILTEAAVHLPENPDEMIATLHQLRTAMGGDSPWQRKIEAELIRKACGDFSIESCLATANLWAADLDGERDDGTFQSLAARAAAIDPDGIEAALTSLPETARASFAAEIIKQLPPEEGGRRLLLLDQLTPAQWDEELGKSLGHNAAECADAIATLPGTTTAGAREGFMETWVQDDPEAATRWFASLPQDDAAGPAAVGLFKGWVEFDKSAAVAWAETLPDGPARQAVALDVVRATAAGNPGEAWRWAASITDLKVRAWSYNVISVSRHDEPEAFRKEHQAVLRAAGME
jgi:hypothetical protein